MRNSFNPQQYIHYTTLLNMFRAARCSSSGGPIVSPQPLVSSLSVSSRTVCRWRADCSTLLIIRRTNCITTASGIVTLCKQPYSMQVESGLQSTLHQHTVWLLTEGDDTRGCGDTIGPPDDEQRAARNMLRSVV